MSGSSPCSTHTSSGYEHEEGYQQNYPDQATSTGGRTGRGGRDWSDHTSQPEGEPPEPDPGMLPLGPRKTVGGQPKPSTSAQQRLKPKPKPSAKSVKEAQEELRRGRKNARRQQLGWQRKEARKLQKVE